MNTDITHAEEDELTNHWLTFENLDESKKTALLRKTQDLFDYAIETKLDASKAPIKYQALRRIIPLIAVTTFPENQSIQMVYRLHVIANHTQVILKITTQDSRKVFECLQTFSNNFKKESVELEAKTNEELSKNLDKYRSFKHPREKMIDNLVLFRTYYSEAFNKSTCCFAFFFKLFHKKGIQLIQDSTHIINTFEQAFKHLKCQADANTLDKKIAILEELQELQKFENQIKALEKRISDHVNNTEKRSTLFSLTKAPTAGAGPDNFKHFRERSPRSGLAPQGA